MIPVTYLDKIRGVLDHLETTQIQAVDKAADLIVQAWKNRGVVYCHMLGHGIEGDSIERAGGLVSVKRFSYSINVSAPAPDCLKAERADPDRDLQRVRDAVSIANLREHDVMLVSSVSGRNREPIEIALACRERKASVISMSSIEYSSNVESLHPSGKKLCEVSDVNIDVGAPYGDAAVNIPGIDVPVMPVSGVSMACCAWMIWGRAMEKAAAAGDPPSVFMSHNREGGPEYNGKSKTRYNERGY